MRCQRQKPSLRRLVKKAEQICRDSQRADCELERLLSGKPTKSNIRSHLHNIKPYRRFQRPAGQVDEAVSMVAGAPGPDQCADHAVMPLT